MGRFDLAELLGEGRTGVSWRGVDRATGEDVVVRMLDVGGSEARAALAAEIAAWQPIPGVVPFTSIVVEDRALALVRAYLEATPLSVVLSDGSGMDLGEALPLFQEVLRLVGALHRSDRVHGSLSSENLLLEEHGATVVPRLVDGGLVRALRLPVDPSPARARYLAPEIEGPDNAGPAADIFALGVLLYELVSGTPPFPGRPVVREGRVAFQRLDRAAPGCPERLSAAVERALSADPRARFLSCTAFAAALPDPPVHGADEPTELDPALYWSDAQTPRRPTKGSALSREVTAPILRVAPPAPPAPSERPTPRRAAVPVVIQLAANSARAVPEDMVREMAEMRAPASPLVRMGMLGIQIILGPLLLCGTLVVGQAWLAGRGLHEARGHAMEARLAVDAELASVTGEVERLARLGADRRFVESHLFSALDLQDLGPRIEAATELRAVLLATARELPRPPSQEAAQDLRGVERRLELLGANAEAQLVVARAAREAEGASLADLADRWGFSEDKPWRKLDASLGQLLRGGNEGDQPEAQPGEP